MRVLRFIAATLIVLSAFGCASRKPEPVASPVPAPGPADTVTRVVHDTVRLRDTAAQAEEGVLRARLLEREAQIEDLQARLEEAQQEVVGALAKSQSNVSRAEAASGIAEAELAVQSRPGSPRNGGTADPGQARRLLQLATDAFNKENYGGALYLAGQAKRLVGGGRPEPPSAREPPRSGETAFASPVRLRAASRANLREGPGTNYKVVFSVGAGTALTAYAYTPAWFQVRDETGRSGWISRKLVTQARAKSP
ncbi:MAG TPA: SH3 domain-containing protein [Gemmatimonadales bacterium]|nr:SH3 domain-containing protein [Gemmatimonadales bacterium]